MTHDLPTQIWRIAIAICMVSALCVSVQVSDYSEMGEQVEDVMELEVEELLSTRRRTNQRRNELWANRSSCSILIASTLFSSDVRTIPDTERSQLNGLGTYLRV